MRLTVNRIDNITTLKPKKLCVIYDLHTDV